MCEMQQEYFRRKLLAWRDELIEDFEKTLDHLSSTERNAGDMVDLASSETDRNVELRNRDRQRKLIAKIDAAMDRLKNGNYGYCAETGRPIGLARLEARPTTSLCIEAQEARERREEIQGRGI